MHCIVEFPNGWTDGNPFEAALQRSNGPHAPESREVTFAFPKGCKMMVDAALRLLSLSNQLAHTTRRVRLDFEENETGTMGYLNRMGFFDNLRSEVEVLPERPSVSKATLHHGNNSMLVEIARINKDKCDKELPRRLEKVISHSCRKRNDIKELAGATYLILAELIQNVFAHSSTELDGYAALQAYAGGNRLSVAVSDSGRGIMATLRRPLHTRIPRLRRLSDTDLLVKVFQEGLSRHGEGRGCGLKGCAEKALKFNAKLDVRLPNQRVVLKPAGGAYEANRAYCDDDLPLIWGTHIAVALGLGV